MEEAAKIGLKTTQQPPKKTDGPSDESIDVSAVFSDSSFGMIGSDKFETIS